MKTGRIWWIFWKSRKALEEFLLSDGVNYYYSCECGEHTNEIFHNSKGIHNYQESVYLIDDNFDVYESKKCSCGLIDYDSKKYVNNDNISFVFEKGVLKCYSNIDNSEIIIDFDYVCSSTLNEKENNKDYILLIDSYIYDKSEIINEKIDWWYL